MSPLLALRTVKDQDKDHWVQATCMNEKHHLLFPVTMLQMPLTPLPIKWSNRKRATVIMTKIMAIVPIKSTPLTHLKIQSMNRTLCRPLQRTPINRIVFLKCQHRRVMHNYHQISDSTFLHLILKSIFSELLRETFFLAPYKIFLKKTFLLLQKWRIRQLFIIFRLFQYI